MKNPAIPAILALVFMVSQSYGQKVKYKDIFSLLNAKQYEQAEPFLKKYISETSDNPNAFLFMGVIYQEKSTKADALKQTQLAIAHMDSAVTFYEKANKMLTEKEVKKNEEFYQMYNRRDLRTGQFGVKLSDIQFDLQKRVESLRERKDHMKMVKHYFSLSDSLYKKSQALFVSLQKSIPGERELYLRADDNTLKALNALAIRFDSATKAFDHYKASAAAAGKIGYDQSLTKTEIKNVKTDGITVADFYQSNIQVWDYGTFARNARQAIEKDIIPLRQHLITYDIEINKLREKLDKDSVSVKNDLTKLVDKLLMEQLKKYDPSPLPMYVFALKINDLDYRSSLIELKRLSDPSNVHLKLPLLRHQVKSIHRLDSVADKLLSMNLDQESANYSHFITNTYNNATVLKSFVRTMKDYAEREQRVKREQLMRAETNLRWIVMPPDSVPLFMEASSNFKPLTIAEEKFTAGLKFADSLSANGYFYTITPSRTPDVKVSFPVDKVNFRQARLPWIKSVTYADGNGQIFFVLVYSERATKENKYAATLAKIYRSDGLAWSTNHLLTYEPREIEFKVSSGELIIRNGDQQHVIDKNGKLLR